MGEEHKRNQQQGIDEQIPTRRKQSRGDDRDR
jgi:hypothetical protein